MKYAEVTYAGPMQSQRVRGPSGERYKFSNPMGGSPISRPVDSVEDAEFFERKGSPYSIEWTAKGELAKKATGPVGDVKEALSEIDYHEKLSLVSDFGLDPDSRSEENLDEELEQVVQDLQTQMEN